ncbi:MAG: class II aldolase/adducin family protein [Rhodobiaceae bacterium]|nr:class II aldolase/adducin family protein [Rhodobiaceae bacterium]
MADGRAKSEAETRREVVETARAMSAGGLSPGRSGNVSARFGAGMLITPSGVAYEGLAPADIVFVGGDGAAQAHRYRPSSEWRFHLAVYGARREAGAIVHAHSRHATVLACAGRPIPAFHYMVAAAGGSDIRCAPYATFGTSELASNVVAALDGRRACLMAHHGQLAFGDSLAAALGLAREVEELAAQYCELLKIGGVGILDEDEMARVLERFKDYGA